MTLDLNAIKARCAAATAPEWYAHGNDVEADRCHQDMTGELLPPLPPLGSFRFAPDAEFIAHAREDIPALVAEVEDLTRKLFLLQAVAESARVVFCDTMGMRHKEGEDSNPHVVMIFEKLGTSLKAAREGGAMDHIGDANIGRSCDDTNKETD